MAAGIHHITAITGKVQANVDFYAGFLGLRLVKRTGGFEDAEQLHLFYGDSVGSPGSLVSFLVWEDGSAGRAGFGQVAEFSLAVAPDSIGFWIGRALEFGVRLDGPRREFDETVLRFTDPDGIVVKLVGIDLAPGAAPPQVRGIAAGDAIRRIRGATLLSDVPEETAAFLATHFGLQPGPTNGPELRLVSMNGDSIDIRNAGGFWPAAPGTGVIDHVAFRAPDRESLAQVERGLAGLNSSLTTTHDRKYFTSLYVREPGGTLLELATDAPGMTLDEPVETLGSRLFVPPGDEARAADLQVMLPQFGLPGEARVRYLDLPFVHRFGTPAASDGTTLVLLHGTGGNETDLMPLAHRIAPHATRLGVRGRSTEEGVQRWFRRTSPTSFDVADIRAEARAFAAFLDMAREGYGLDPERIVVLGYSNGANFAAATMMLHPGSIRRAILFRPALVLPPPPGAGLDGAQAVLIAGADDDTAEFLPSPASALRDLGAAVEEVAVPAGHGLTDADVEAGRTALARLVAA